MSLEGKATIITGGSTGIGAATALLFARQGANVLITARREEKLKEVQKKALDQGLEIDYLVSDVSKEEDCKEAVDFTVNKHGRIDILFNNAGVLTAGTTHETPTDVWERTFDINVKGIYFMSKYAIPHMIKQGKGNIINNSSIIGLRGFPGASAYVASKGAVTQLTRAMAREYIGHGIRVNAICPGGIETPMVTDDVIGKSDNPEAVEEFFVSQHPIGRLGKPEEIAHAVEFLSNDNVEFMTGSMLSVDGGWAAT